MLPLCIDLPRRVAAGHARIASIVVRLLNSETRAHSYYRDIVLTIRNTKNETRVPLPLWLRSCSTSPAHDNIYVASEFPAGHRRLSVRHRAFGLHLHSKLPNWLLLGRLYSKSGVLFHV